VEGFHETDASEGLRLKSSAINEQTERLIWNA
jgi:hypothetical protein